MYKSLQIITAALAACILSIPFLIFVQTTKEPCIDNFREGWFYYMEQSELMDTDETETEKQFHNAIVSVVKEQGNLYISQSGREYVVPSYCYAEDTGFSVKLWRKE
jgi:hypothetical protein